MVIFSIPVTRWPLKYAVLVVCITIFTTAFSWNWTRKLGRTKIELARQELSRNTAELQVAQNDMRNEMRSSFIDDLPQIAKSDEVFRDISKQAQDFNVQISSITVVRPESSVAELRKVEFSLTAIAEYKAIKNWLSEILGRYSSVGVQNMSIRPLMNDSTRQETQMVLVFYVHN